MADYIKWIRKQVGKNKIMLNYASAIILDDNGNILLQKRSELADAWGFPGGALELGESAEEAVKREVIEETGLNVKVNDLLGVYTKYTDQYPSGDVAQPIVICFICSIEGGVLDSNNSETEQLHFFPIQEAPSLYNPQQRDAMDDLLANRRGVSR